MNHRDPFEERLRRLPLCEPPPEWRAEILAEARSVSKQRRSPPATAAHSSWAGWLRELLWPAPRAWAGLAGVWAALLVFDIVTSESAPGSLARETLPAAPQTREQLRAQHQLYAELIGLPAERRSEGRPPSRFPPHSRLKEEFAYV